MVIRPPTLTTTTTSGMEVTLFLLHLRCTFRVGTFHFSRMHMLKARSENSEPIAPYMLVPTTAHTASEYQQPYKTQLGYEPTLDHTPTAFPIPLSSQTATATASHGITSQQFPHTTSAPTAPSAPAPVQARALHMPYITRSRPRKSLLAQEVDAPKATSDGRHSHPLFRHSRCTGKRKAVCVRAPT